MIKPVRAFHNRAEFYNPQLLVKAKPFIQQIVLSLCSKYELPNAHIVIKWNNRYRTSMAAFELGHPKDYCWLIFNTNFVLGCMYDWDGYGQKALQGVTTHEALHYILYAKGLPSSDGSKQFEQALADNNAPSSSRTGRTLQKSQIPLIGYSFDGNRLCLIINEHKEKINQTTIKKLSKTDEVKKLNEAQKIILKELNEFMNQYDVPNKVNIDIKFSGRLKKTFVSYHYYDNNEENLHLNFNKKQILSMTNLDELNSQGARKTLVKVIQIYLRDYHIFSIEKNGTNIMG